MAATHEVPNEFKDENKWFRLTIRQWIIIGPITLLVVMCNIAVFTSPFRFLLPVTLIFGGCIVITAALIAAFPMPKDKYLFGGGMHMEVILFRLLKKKLWFEKKIYTKYCNNDYKRWLEE